MLRILIVYSMYGPLFGVAGRYAAAIKAFNLQIQLTAFHTAPVRCFHLTALLRA